MKLPSAECSRHGTSSEFAKKVCGTKSCIACTNVSLPSNLNRRSKKWVLLKRLKHFFQDKLARKQPKAVSNRQSKIVACSWKIRSKKFANMRQNWIAASKLNQKASHPIKIQPTNQSKKSRSNNQFNYRKLFSKAI